MLVLSNADVQRVLTMSVCLDALDAMFHEIARGDAAGMGRIDVYIPSGQTSAPYYRWAVMAGGSRGTGYLCARMLSDMVAWPVVAGHQRENKFAARPGTFCGLLFLYRAEDGVPVAMIQDGYLQHIRVGGGAGIGVKYLSRTDSQSVGMIGSGGMARTYLEAFCAVRDIRSVKVYSPNADNRRQYAAEVRARFGVEAEAVDSPRDAVRGVDIVSCCTSSTEPDFFADWLEPGMHVTDLGRESTGPGFISAVDVAFRPGDSTSAVDDLPPEAFYATHGFLAHVAGTPDERAQVPRLALDGDLVRMPKLPDLLAGRAPGRTSADQTSWFLNVGAIGIQFAAVAAAVYERARAEGLGVELPDEYFLQDVRD
jgi:ornithine cyclodeaminase/alanine dehydrogenase-like protein (mu-crystallin family)